MCDINILISCSSLLIAIISIYLSIRAFYFTKRIRKIDKQPLFEYSNSFGGSIKRDKKFPAIYFELINSGEKAIVTKIINKTDKNIFFSQINKTIGNKELLEFQLESCNRIEFDDFKYEIDLYFKDIDNKTYIQKIKGVNIYFKISSPKEI
jgi:hypothetical protein